MNKYNNGKIYTLRCHDDQTLIYVGSTTQPLYKRFFEHKRDASKFKERTLYTKMNELGIDKFYIELYELYSCNSKEELNKREGEVIRLIGTLNMEIAGRTGPEYYIDNKEKINIKDRKYYNENAEKIKENKKEYRATLTDEQNQAVHDRKREKITCICGCIAARSDIAKHMKTKKHIDLMNNINI
jgi:hypothetical protein